MTTDTIESAAPLTAFVGKLERRGPLAADARAAFFALPHSIIRCSAGDVVAKEGDASHCSFFVSSGFVSRQKQVQGTAQIVGVGIAGDAVDLQSLWFHQCDHSLVVHSPATLISVAHVALVDLCNKSSQINRALWHDTLVDAAIFREWALNIGHRTAKLRIGHLMLELATRYRSHGLTMGDVFELPLTQGGLASALGLSLVHTNKSLKSLRCDELLEISNQRVRILDRERLEQLTGFDPAYLHTNEPPKFSIVSTAV